MLVIPAPSIAAAAEPEAVDDTDTDRSTLASKLFFGGRGGMHDPSSFSTCFAWGEHSDGVGVALADGLAVAVTAVAVDCGTAVPFPGKQWKKEQARVSDQRKIPSEGQLLWPTSVRRVNTSVRVRRL